MSGQSSVFKSPEGEAEYGAAYAATLAAWPVPFHSLCVPTRAGRTHVIASGPKDAPPLVLLPMTFISATMWMYNMADLSRSYRVYALDTIGDVGNSLPEGPLNSRADILRMAVGCLRWARVKKCLHGRGHRTEAVWRWGSPWTSPKGSGK